MSLLSSIVQSVLTGNTGRETSTSAIDLYSVDHRKFTVQHCDAKAAARRAALDASVRNRGLISGLEKIAGIEGLGQVQEAMDAIVSATHVGGLEWERIVDSGTEGILTRVVGEKVTGTVLEVINDVSPQAINKAVSSAKQIHDKVSARDFDWKDIPQYVSDFKNLLQIGSTIIDPYISSNAANQAPVVSCSASPYATDLVNLGVKMKFLFVVEFVFNPQYQNIAAVTPAFVVKTTDRPSISYELEDVNMYNFRTKVAKRGVFAPLTMSFYDDEQNHAVAFYNAMMRLMSPVTNSTSPLFLETDGMYYGEGLTADTTGVDSPTQGVLGYRNAATIGPLLGNNVSILHSINLYHVYMGGKRVNKYVFHRPRVQAMSLDGMDMMNGESSEMRMEFAYDNVEIINHDANAMAGRSDSRIDNLPGIRYPLGAANNVNSEDLSAKEASLTQVTGPLAELYARGEGFAGQIVTGVTNMAGDVRSAASSALSSVFG